MTIVSQLGQNLSFHCFNYDLKANDVQIFIPISLKFPNGHHQLYVLSPCYHLPLCYYDPTNLSYLLDYLSCPMTLSSTRLPKQSLTVFLSHFHSLFNQLPEYIVSTLKFQSSDHLSHPSFKPPLTNHVPSFSLHSFKLRNTMFLGRCQFFNKKCFPDSIFLLMPLKL